MTFAYYMNRPPRATRYYLTVKFFRKFQCIVWGEPRLPGGVA